MPPNQHASDKGKAHGKGKPAKPAKPAKVKNPTCVLKVPKDPTTAAGLATPWELGSGSSTCTVSDPATSVTVTATITDPAGTVTTYSPLVVDEGTPPVGAPAITPNVPPGATVELAVTFSGERLKLVGPGARTSIKVN